MFINSMNRGGYDPLQHHNPKLASDGLLHVREVRMACRVLDRDERGGYFIDQDSAGDQNCFTFWPNEKQKRETGSWANVFPAVGTYRSNNQPPVTPPGQGRGATPKAQVGFAGGFHEVAEGIFVPHIGGKNLAVGLKAGSVPRPDNFNNPFDRLAGNFNDTFENMQMSIGGVGLGLNVSGGLPFFQAPNPSQRTALRGGLLGGARVKIGGEPRKDDGEDPADKARAGGDLKAPDPRAEVGFRERLVNAPPTTGSRRSQATAAGRAFVSPLFANAQPDQRFQTVNQMTPPGFPKLIEGILGMVTSGTAETKQEKTFHPTDPRMVAVNDKGDPAMGSLVGDTNQKFSLNPERTARMQSAFRVITPDSIQKSPLPKAPQIALQMGLSGMGDTGSIGMITDQSDGKQTSALAGIQGAGPLDVGENKDDKHKIGSDLDGNQINSAHISTKSFYKKPKDKEKDAPLEFKDEEFIRPPTPGWFPTPVNLRYDPKSKHDHLGEKKEGLWRWQGENWGTIIDEPEARVEIDNPGPKKQDPPEKKKVNDDVTTDFEKFRSRNGQGKGRTPDPTRSHSREITIPLPIPDDLRGGPPRSGPGFTHAREVSEPHEAFGMTLPPFSINSLLFRPIDIFDKSQPDFRKDMSVDLTQIDAYNETAPTVGRIESWSAHTGGGEGSVVYEENPCQGRFKGGTSAGGMAIMSPEMSIDDYITGFNPIDRNGSDTFFLATPGTKFGSGLPDLGSGGINTGIQWGDDPLNPGEMLFEAVDPSGIATEIMRLTQNEMQVGGVKYPTTPGAVGEVLEMTSANQADWQPAGGAAGITTINPGGNIGPTVSFQGVGGIVVSSGGSNVVNIDGSGISPTETDPLSIHKDGSSVTSGSIPFAAGITMPDNQPIRFGSTVDYILDFDTSSGDLVLNRSAGSGFFQVLTPLLVFLPTTIRSEFGDFTNYDDSNFQVRSGTADTELGVFKQHTSSSINFTPLSSQFENQTTDLGIVTGKQFGAAFRYLIDASGSGTLEQNGNTGALNAQTHISIATGKTFKTRNGGVTGLTVGDLFLTGSGTVAVDTHISNLYVGRGFNSTLGGVNVESFTGVYVDTFVGAVDKSIGVFVPEGGGASSWSAGILLDGAGKIAFARAPTSVSAPTEFINSVNPGDLDINAATNINFNTEVDFKGVGSVPAGFTIAQLGGITNGPNNVSQDRWIRVKVDGLVVYLAAWI